MDYSKIRAAVEAAQSKADELGIKISVAIVDDHGELISFDRQEGAVLSSVYFSQSKAFTAGSTGMSTSDLAPYTESGKPLYGAQTLAGGKITTIPGGIPIRLGEKLVGAVGVGGSYDPNQDVECVKAALEILQG